MTACVVLVAFVGAWLGALAESAGYADEEGRFVEAESPVTNAVPAAMPCADWKPVPLGAFGTQAVATAFARLPTYCPRPVRRDGLVLYDGKTSAVLVRPATKSLRRLADEFKYHLERMTGTEFTYVDTASADVPSVVFEKAGDQAELATATTIGSRLVIGGRGSGVSHALTYVLETLGCRYLWPGRLGKVIPRRERVVVPHLAWTNVPTFRVRHVREPRFLHPRWNNGSLRPLGFDAREEGERWREAATDAPGNRGFWQWHGVNDEKVVEDALRPAECAWVWGHAFEGYWKRYGQEHPDWFALQADGTRTQGRRPRLCLSNRALREATARDLIADFAAHPQARCRSICLPDGGPTSICLCPDCRRLDPSNGNSVSFPISKPVRGEVGYVSVTDRVLDFNNAVAELVTQAMPGRKLTMYAYSLYSDPPLRVRPHSALVILSTAGSYINWERRLAARRLLAGWSAYGNPLLWRPNALGGFLVASPQNYARRLKEDVELFRVNGVVGTDFDVMDLQFANKGLVYYVLARTLLNPDCLDYDALLDEYCEAGFGPAAAEIRAYFYELERVTDKAARRTPGRDRRRICDALMEVTDPVALQTLLDRAESAAGKDEMVLRRIAFLRTGVRYSEWERALWRLMRADDPAWVEKVEAFKAFVRKETRRDPIAVSPIYIGFYDPYCR